MKFQFKDEIKEIKDITDPLFGEILKECYPNCMCIAMKSVEPIYSLYLDIKYILQHDIAGDIVECGVWKGGMMQFAALLLKKLGDESRNLYLYDTYSGMPEPGDYDFDWDNNSAKETYNYHQQKGLKWGYGGSLDDVKNNLFSTGYPQEKIYFIEGLVEETIPKIIPKSISILRLDTDFYDSTKHELNELYPLLNIGGILIIDDYGYYKGSRKATDEYIADNKVKILLHRIQSSVYQGVKIE